MPPCTMQSARWSLLSRINDRRGESTALTSLGLIALESEGPAVARNYQEQALLIAREVNDRYLGSKNIEQPRKYRWSISG